MARSKKKQPPAPPPPCSCYAPLPPQPQDQNSTVLPYNDPDNIRPNWRRRIYTISLLLLPALVVYVFWPSEPEVKVQRFHLTRVQVHTKPVICIDISLNLTLKVHNLAVYSMDYKSLDVKVGYRGKNLGHVRSEHGHVKALGSSYVDAELELECVKVLSDLVFLLEDLARGSVPFDALTEVSGKNILRDFGKHNQSDIFPSKLLPKVKENRVKLMKIEIDLAELKDCRVSPCS